MIVNVEIKNDRASLSAKDTSRAALAALMNRLPENIEWTLTVHMTTTPDVRVKLAELTNAIPLTADLGTLAIRGTLDLG